MKKLIITVAPTGNVNKDENPNVPISPTEIAEDIRIAAELGASVAHIHARDRNGKPTHDKRVNQEILEELTKRNVKIITELTTGIRGDEENSAASRGQMFDLACDLITMTPGSFNYKDDIYMNHPQMVTEFCKRITASGLKPSLAVADAGMIQNSFDLLDKGCIESPILFYLMMGLSGCIPATPKNLLFLSELIPAQHVWTLMVEDNWPLTVMAIVLGGHVRVGIEDSICHEHDKMATNRMLVERVARIARELGREIATVDEAREILGI